MSAEDVWQLKIPIRLSLSSSEITSPGDVKPVYLLAPRHAYLPALAQQCLGFFQHVLLSLPGQSQATPWFEYQGLPLNWTQPLGVLHDLLTPTPATAADTSAASSARSTSAEAAPGSFSPPSSPWSLTVHYQNMPASLQNNWQNAGAAKDHYFSSLKVQSVRWYPAAAADDAVHGSHQTRVPAESSSAVACSAVAAHQINRVTACRTQCVPELPAADDMLHTLCSFATACGLSQEAGYCCRGSDGCGAVMRLPGSAQDELWSAVNRGAGQAVQTVLTQLRMQPTQKPGGGPCSVPVRVYIRKHKQGSRAPGLLEVWSDTYSSSRPIDLTQADGSATLLAHVLHTVMPQEFPAPCSPAGVTQLPAVGGQHEQQQQATTAQLPVSPGASNTSAAGAAGVDTEAAVASDPLMLHGSCTAVRAEAGAADPAEGQPSAAGTAGSPDAIAEAPEQLQSMPAVTSPRACTVSAAANHVLTSDWPSKGVSVLVYGVQPDWCTPLGWLHAHLRAADGFLYIVVHVLEQS
eukprot:GHUV01031296.1.p1 GENE.GHUV01031296.1~~GHUV01031296.1.p1  ORF type:complete len:520 (+),score=168.61 GHUV01031296.1:310-1869(+)